MKSNNLKIGLVFDDTLDSNDGVQQYVKSLGRWLLGQGFEVRFLVGETHDAGDLQQYVRSLSKNITFRGNQNKMFLPINSSGKHIDKVLKEEQFDVLHVMMPTNPFMGSRVVRRAGKTPVVGTFHMVGGTWFISIGAKLLALAQRTTLKRIGTYLSVSKAAQTFEREHFGIESQVSPNMVDTRAYKKGQPKEFLKGKNSTITFLGRLVERKGAIHLLEAVKILHQEGKLEGVRVNICGDGELRPELEEFVRDHQLEGNVFFHGFIDEDEKSDYLASSDIAIFPSTGGEAFGIVLIEAMSTGKSVVLGGDNSGYRTVLGGRDELLFDPYGHYELATKLAHFITDKRARDSAIAWQSSEVEQYDIDVVGHDVVVCYRDASSRKIL